MSKQPPQVITSLPPQPHFFIAPSPVAAAPGYTLQLPPHVSTPHSSSLTSISQWPASIAPLRPQAPFNCPAEVYFAAAAQPCILPTISTKSTKGLTPSSSLLRDNSPSPSLSSTVKIEEPHLTNCKIISGGGEEKRVSYPINALIDVPGSLNRGSRTSSLNSSLSSIRFGGSLSQLWATSLSSLNNKVNGMKSTGNLHAEASMPSLGNQYVALGGSLPELSLTSLTRLLPNSSANTTVSNGSDTTAGNSGLYTLIQSPLCVYPSQSHLATPFINANGSITFGSFLSSGSSLCSAQLTSDSSPPPTRSNEPRHTDSPDSPGCYGNTSVSSNNGGIAPGNLSTLAYVASAQKTLDTSCGEGFPLMTVSNHLPGQSPLAPPSSHGLSPIQPPTSCLSPEDHSLEIDCHVSSPGNPPPTGYGVLTSVGGGGASMATIKIEESDHSQDFHHSYVEVKPHPHDGKKDSFKDKPYKCDYPGCGRSFSFPAHLRSHVQQIHISYRPCKCDFPGCGKRFYTPQHLNVHRRIHTGERPFVCPYADCGKAFTTAGNLKNHIRTHTGERPYACKFDGCSKRFAEMSSLKKHELTHTGEKPYKCRVCGKAFSQAGSRNTHERKHNRSGGEEGDGKLARRYRIKRVSQDDDL